MNNYRIVIVMAVILTIRSLVWFPNFAPVIADNILCADISLCIATNMSDVMMGDEFSNHSMFSLNGTDIMIGSKGNDSFSGGERTDQNIGGGGDDIISGGNGE